MENKILFTSESVSEGHPDKLCDQIADAILDAVLEEDSNSFCACECFATTNLLVIGGEITTKAKIDYESVARSVIQKVGYDSDELGFNFKNVQIINCIKEQSPNIRQGVLKESPELQGAGDQGIMFGYASDETEGYMPLAISIAHKLVREATKQRKNGQLVHARPDMKSQVTIDYTDKEMPRIDTILMSVQHDSSVTMDEFKNEIFNKVMLPVVKSFGLNTDFKVLFNPTGRFEIGGPMGDTGLTGRKIIVDTYGGSARHGGGAFSGKDPSKVDRSAAYMARYIAKNLVAAGVAKRIEIQLSYAIGKPEPQSISISTFKTSKYDDKIILELINKVFDCRPGMIIKNFSLKKPSFKYQDISNYGHFGRPDLDLPWEKLDKVNEIKEFLNSL
ncbi:MAG: methionine adenosyltransferase [Candidatus Onthovivens sp.]|nr:methionine adenosyltransferase [Candidatus Onthovivens sp.]